tara:strand:+ start:145 stop:519 length:375 start_codon:yes stop_codon:yes gene_type:complete
LKVEFTLEQLVKVYYNLSLINKMKEMLYEDMLLVDKNYDSDKLLELIIDDVDGLEKNIILIEKALLEELKDDYPTPTERKEKIQEILFADPYYVLMEKHIKTLKQPAEDNFLFLFKNKTKEYIN